jgi:poly-gamma-glutamate synthesis protein (capsule biosynthesis protein)
VILLGDIAIPSLKYSTLLDRQLSRYPWIFGDKPIVCNLEGLIMDDYDTTDSTPILFNHSSVLSVLKNYNCKYVALANNHTLDKPNYFGETVSAIAKSNIAWNGAGRSSEEASKPAIVDFNGKKIIIFNSCWHVMLQHQANPNNGVYVNIIKEDKTVQHVKEYRKLFPESIIMIYPHWNFDLESLPFPMHREWSFDLIDAGANMIVGGHSHCIQGGEKYKKGYIIYGLGNFYIPWHTFINGHISFPEFARNELAVEWDFENEPILHFFKYTEGNDEHNLDLLASESFSNSSILTKYSPYANMSQNDYLDFFNINRRKKNLVPIYKSYKTPLTNRMKDYYLIMRIRLARKLARIGLRGWNN